MLNSKFRNALLGAVLTSGIGACTTTNTTTQPIEIDNKDPIVIDLSSPVVIDRPPYIAIDHMQFVEIRTPITQARASRIIQDFNKAERVVPPVANESNPPPITITINSTGGSVEGGYRILREIENSPSQIHFKCDKQAFSIAATIFISATGRNRDATEECKLMIHEPYITAYNPNAPKRKTTRTKYEALLPHYRRAMENPNIQKFSITQRGASPYELSREEIVIGVELLTEDRNIIKERLASTTYLTADDIEVMLGNGDNYFSVESAAFAGMIDTINGAPPSDTQLQQGQIEFCNNLPKLSLCS